MQSHFIDDEMETQLIPWVTQLRRLEMWIGTNHLSTLRGSGLWRRSRGWS